MSMLRLAKRRRTSPWSARSTERSPRCPQSSNGHRVGIVGVVLVGAPRGQHPDPRGQGGRHVEHVFAPGYELLGQQIAQATRRLDGPGALLEGSAQLMSWSTWRRVARTLKLES